ncbi:molybdopterin-dependent oxidoreductase [Halomonas llamarensis]|uniref:Molybdopterin-dependent oxidoreductase n=1 Tax=Halomonas llamarensis TaxID=2945104 RepID=A0ABT0SQD2_9GAMM|nr:molybdopterin-dependent oxidoreductase [Halomonas llamarensis]MCL7930024.1 molybdopterin-dependent oxidoreductase [Halomonas llamarensis]
MLITVLASLAPIANAATPISSQEIPSDDHSLMLQITHYQYHRWLSLADIETLPLYDVAIEHPEGLNGRFTGVWLDEFIVQQGIPEDAHIRFIAHDDYTIFLSPAEREKRRYLMVTRFNGQPLKRQHLGPLLLIVPADAESVLSGTSDQTRWIWSIRELRYQ